MGYLVTKDYKSFIQTDYLRQLTQADPDRRYAAENQATQDIVQRLTQKYDLSLEFTDTAPWSASKTYGAGDRVTVEISTDGFTAWTASTAYVVGDAVINAGTGYFCTTANSDATFTPSKWASVGTTGTIYHAAFPDTCTLQGQPHPATLTDPYAPMFFYQNVYAKGDVVWWRGNTYVCNMATEFVTHDQALYWMNVQNQRIANVLPDNPVANANGRYWTNRTDYVVEAGTPLTDDAWVLGDNRNQSIRAAMVVMSVFRLSPLISPGNMPDDWLDSYKGVLRDLNEAKMGEQTLLLPLRQPLPGLKTRYGTQEKRVNNY